MAREIISAGKMTVNSVDLSEYVTTVALEDTADEVDTTNLASNGYKSAIQGLKTSNMTATFQVDHATGKVADTLQVLYDSGSVFPVKVWPKASGTIVYTLGSAQIMSKPLWGGGVGDLATVDATFVLAGGTVGITRGTA
jgi:hypothetical protein